MAETTIGLAGNPNCGKTTLFNELTGSNGYVGNWPGVTVEKKQATWRQDKSVTFVDLPGIYSLSPTRPREVVSRDYIVGERPDAIINLVDVTNLEAQPLPHHAAARGRAPRGHRPQHVRPAQGAR